MLEFFHTLFASAAILWGTLIGLVLVIAILLENEKEGWATTIVSISLALAFWLNKDSIMSFVSQNPSQLIGFVLSYILVGVVWSFIKWQLYVRKAFKPLKELKAEFIAKHKVLNEATLPKLNAMINSARILKPNGYEVSASEKTPFEDTVNNITPLASKKKSVITSWISYWPISLSATLLNNPFRHFFEWLYENLSGLYDRITNANKKSLLHD